ncbi:MULTISPECIES: hypothetical protein [Acinetobacter]|uniref:hypothetical protein n=1 Tax=Acinetobacter TaxID=469 RepID=UPI0015B72B8B|nr:MULTISPECIES: hypothetical protein [Acinetobacter]MBT0888703.1 hypothetical protein [Acinetobacter towneri]NWJ94111.1 hypothetical protein [Acinetobacter sp. Swhac1]
MIYFYIMKDGLYLHVESIEYESDYHSVSEITGQAATRYSWVKDQDLAVRFIDRNEANTYLAKLPRKPFFRNAEVK